MSHTTMPFHPSQLSSFHSQCTELKEASSKLSRQMKRPLTLLDGHSQFRSKHLQRAVIGQLEIVDAGHDARKVLVRGQRRFCRLANDREHWRQCFEACNQCQHCSRYSAVWRYSPPIGSLGLPLANCKKSRRSVAVYSDIVCSRLRTLALSRLNP